MYVSEYGLNSDLRSVGHGRTTLLFSSATALHDSTPTA